MDFYRDISDYYDYIFPFKEVTYNFLLDSYNLSSNKGNSECRILDIACGSGIYALNLASNGGQVIATDLDPLMIAQAQAKNKNRINTVTFKVHNMLELDQLEDPSLGFDFVYCIGNSIVHLDTIDEIYSVINSVYELLNFGGTFVIQIINFDRILKEQVNELPTIVNEDEGVTFKREYNHLDHEHKIEFSTVLDIETQGMTERYTQSVKLYPLVVNELVKGFEDAGFLEIELFGGFNGIAYDRDTSYPTIIRGVKNK